MTVATLGIQGAETVEKCASRMFEIGQAQNSLGCFLLLDGGKLAFLSAVSLLPSMILPPLPILFDFPSLVPYLVGSFSHGTIV
jgi:hypothetical protein